MKRAAAGAILLTLPALLAVPLAVANPGGWWKGFGTATGPDGSVYGLEFYYGGMDLILDCAGFGCRGAGDGYLIVSDLDGVADAKYPYAGVDDLRNLVFGNDPDFCPSQPGAQIPLVVKPDYSLVYSGGSLTGIHRDCLSTGINKHDFTGTFLTFDLVIHSEGPFGVAHG